MSKRTKREMLLLLIAGMTGLIASITTGAATSGAQETIIYSTLRPANWDIYLFEKRGAPPRKLTDDPALDYNAVFSPDGRYVVFCSERRGNPDLYALDLKNEGAPRLLIDSPAMEDAPAFSPNGRTLSFVSTRDGSANIYTVPFQPDKTLSPEKAVNLTRHESGNFNPAFSPDGRRIAFASERTSSDRFGPPSSHECDLFVMNADGSNVTQLTQAKGWEGSPAWSADGQTIYFYAVESWQPLGPPLPDQPRIWRMKADGTEPRAVSTSSAKAISPARMPEGRCAFAMEVNKQWRIVSLAADGSDQQVESDASNDYWAPDFDRTSGRMVCHGTGPMEAGSRMEAVGNFGNASQVPFFVAGSQTDVSFPDRMLPLRAFRSFTSAINPQTGAIVGAAPMHAGEHAMSVVTAQLDGSGLREVFKPAGGMAWGTVWSHDGNWISFTAGPPFAPLQAPADIWKMRADGSGAVNLTADSKANNGFPDFSPDDRRLVFRSGRDGNQEIYLMGADGKNARRLTDHPATDTMPAFAPSGDLIAFASNRDGNFEIYTLSLYADGAPRELRRITRDPSHDNHPRFSPDGKWLVFTSDRSGINDEEPLDPNFTPQPAGEIWAWRLADGKTVRLTHNKWEDGVPSWSLVKK